jgi:hypothetical protein
MIEKNKLKMNYIWKNNSEFCIEWWLEE